MSLERNCLLSSADSEASFWASSAHGEDVFPPLSQVPSKSQCCGAISPRPWASDPEDISKCSNINHRQPEFCFSAQDLDATYTISIALPALESPSEPSSTLPTLYLLKNSTPIS